MVKKTLLSINYSKLVDHAFEPEYSSIGAAGLDLKCVDVSYNYELGFMEYGTGIAIQIPEGFVGLLFPRSSVSNTPHSLANSVGVIDSDYRGEIIFRFRNTTKVEEDYNAYSYGDKIGQLIIVPYPKIILKEVKQLEDTKRGFGGFGSTGR